MMDSQELLDAAHAARRIAEERDALIAALLARNAELAASLKEMLPKVGDLYPSRNLAAVNRAQEVLAAHESHGKKETA